MLIATISGKVEKETCVKCLHGLLLSRIDLEDSSKYPLRNVQAARDSWRLEMIVRSTEKEFLRIVQACDRWGLHIVQTCDRWGDLSFFFFAFFDFFADLFAFFFFSVAASDIFKPRGVAGMSSSDLRFQLMPVVACSMVIQFVKFSFIISSTS